jgi:hypothetical protein
MRLDRAIHRLGERDVVANHLHVAVAACLLESEPDLQRAEAAEFWRPNSWKFVGVSPSPPSEK